MNIDAKKVIDHLLEQIKEHARVIAILQAQLSELQSQVQNSEQESKN